MWLVRRVLESGHPFSPSIGHHSARCPEGPFVYPRSKLLYEKKKARAPQSPVLWWVRWEGERQGRAWGRVAQWEMRRGVDQPFTSLAGPPPRPSPGSLPCRCPHSPSPTPPPFSNPFPLPPLLPPPEFRHIYFPLAMFNNNTNNADAISSTTTPDGREHRQKYVTLVTNSGLNFSSRSVLTTGRDTGGARPWMGTQSTLASPPTPVHQLPPPSFPCTLLLLLPSAPRDRSPCLWRSIFRTVSTSTQSHRERDVLRAYVITGRGSS